MFSRSQPLLLGLALFTMLSCKKSTKNEIISPGDTVKVTTGVDVYMYGTSSVTGSTVKVATWWKNGVMKKISDSTSATATFPKDLVISGNDVYLIGAKGTATVYWKNGVEMGTIAGNGNGIVFSNGDMYVYGSAINQGKQVGRYWKNGVPTDLDQCRLVTAMAIKGTDVYVIGSAQTTTGKFIATYWKNGARKLLTTDSSNHSFANGITVSGNDVYIGGQSAATHAIYWKNDVPVELTTGVSSAVNSIAIKNGNVYCFGYRKEGVSAANSCYWKDNVLKDLIKDPLSTINSKASGIAIVGSDVYIAGGLGTAAAYWKGAAITTFPGSTTVSYAGIKLVERY